MATRKKQRALRRGRRKMSPFERRRAIDRIQENDDLSRRQQRNRAGLIYDSGPVMRVDPYESRVARRLRRRQHHREDRAGRHDRLPPPDMDAYAILFQKFKDYGLEGLAPVIKDMLIKGSSAAEVEMELQETHEWKQRFAGNEKLRQKGLPVLSVSEYLAVEQSYAQIMKNYGLPEGFYDDPEDFAGFIGKSVSPGEIESRVSSYADIARREDPAIREQLQAMGFSEGDLLAWMMDPDRANPLLQRKAEAIKLGGAARRTGTVASNNYLEKLAGMGVTEQQAQEGYSVISESLADVQRLGDIYGTDFSQRDFEEEVFEGSGESARKRKRLASQERAAFSGDSGVGRGSLTRSDAGSF